MSNSRQERRVYWTYVTRNSEYHFRGSRCVAVRERQRGNWLLAHQALERKLTAAVQMNDRAEPCPTLKRPRVGDALFFGTDGPDLITSCIVAVERPSKEVVEGYPL